VSGRLYIGAAGWQLPREGPERFPREGTHLQRYAGVLNAVEINSTFKRSHQLSTYEKWAGTVPEGFAFAVKAPREITHTRRLQDIDEPLGGFLDETAGLDVARGPILFQLPPGLAYDRRTVERFCGALRDVYSGYAVLEPRHESWRTEEAEALLAEYRLARAAVDPARFDTDARPGGWDGLVYFRLHGSPRMYYSSYDGAYLEELAGVLQGHRNGSRQVWCIFDNTAAGAGAHNALELVGLTKERPPESTD